MGGRVSVGSGAAAPPEGGWVASDAGAGCGMTLQAAPSDNTIKLINRKKRFILQFSLEVCFQLKIDDHYQDLVPDRRKQKKPPIAERP
jgi:hypothetical protein